MLTLQFMPYYEIENLSSNARIKKVLELIKENKIVMLEGRLKKEEETELIKKTMEEIGSDSSNPFKGIELSVIQPSLKKADFFKQMRIRFLNILLGDRQGFTVVGPASIVREIKQDPDKLQLYIDDIANNANLTKNSDNANSNNKSKTKQKKSKKKNKKK